MKKVLFDLTPTQWIANGAGIYTWTIFEKAISTGYQFEGIYSSVLELPMPVKDMAQKANCKLISYHNERDIERITRENEYDLIFFGALTNVRLNYPKNTWIIVTLHDVRFMEVYGDRYRHLYRDTFAGRLKQKLGSILIPSYDLKKQYKEIKQIFRHKKLRIITVSNHTKHSILQYFPQVIEENILVYYSPYPGKLNYKNNTFDDYLITNKIVPGKYVLIISANRWIKNSYRAIIAIDQLVTSNQLKGHKAVVVGKVSKAIKSKIQNKDSFIFLDYVTTEQLYQLYENAFCFLYPTLQEGFGIPPLEAMNFETPVLASAVSSIPEICGDAVLYFNPYSVSEIKNRLLQLHFDDNVRLELLIKSKNHLEKLWEKQKADLEALLRVIFDKGNL